MQQKTFLISLFTPQQTTCAQNVKSYRFISRMLKKGERAPISGDDRRRQPGWSSIRESRTSLLDAGACCVDIKISHRSGKGGGNVGDSWAECTPPVCAAEFCRTGKKHFQFLWKMLAAKCTFIRSKNTFVVKCAPRENTTLSAMLRQETVTSF